MYKGQFCNISDIPCNVVLACLTNPLSFYGSYQDPTPRFFRTNELNQLIYSLCTMYSKIFLIVTEDRREKENDKEEKRPRYVNGFVATTTLALPLPHSLIVYIFTLCHFVSPFLFHVSHSSRAWPIVARRSPTF